MKKQYNSWEDLFGKRLQNLQPEPAFDAWDRIEAELEGKPKRIAWYWIAAALTMLSLPAGFWAWEASQEQKSITLTGAHRDVAITGEPLTDSPTQNIKKPATEAQVMTPTLDTPPVLAEGNHSVQQHTRLEQESSKNSQHKQHNKDHTAAMAGADLAAVDQSKITRAELSTHLPSAGSPLARNKAVKNFEDSALTGGIGQEKSLAAITAIAPSQFPLKYRLEVPEFKPSYAVEEQLVVVREKEQGKKNASPARLWVSATPTWSYRRIEPKHTDNVVITAVEDQSALASERMGGQVAAGIAYPLGKKIQWKSGAYYWYQQQQFSYSYHDGKASGYVAKVEASNNFRITPQFDEQSQAIDMNLHNLGISTGLSFQLPTKFANSALETKVHLQYNAYQPVNSLLSIGYNIEAKLDTKTRLTLGPSLQMQLNNNQSTSPYFDDKPLSAGLQMGVIF